MSQRKFSTIGDNNDGCYRGDDGEDTLWWKGKTYHIVDHPPKRRKSHRSSNDSELEICKYLEDMEVHI